MNPVIKQVIDTLDGAGFEFPVAIYPDRDPELGDVVEVDAFDVPAGVAVAVSSRLGDFVWPVAFSSGTMLPGIVYDSESAARRATLPPDTVWYTPRARSHVRA